MRLLMTSFGYDDSGGGTAVPREVSKELVRRGWEVTVFHAAVKPDATGIPYQLREWTEDGVRLIGVHNRPSVLFDYGNPDRELNDPQITAAFAATLDQVRPDVVHFHNLHNLGAALFDEVAVRALPAYFTTHNYWLICPRAYLITSAGQICPGPGDGRACASCNHGASAAPAASGALGTEAQYIRRLGEIRARAEHALTRILAVSDAVRDTLIGAGYPATLIDVVRQAMPQDAVIWEKVGSRRRLGRHGPALTVAFIGSAYPHKGPQLLIEAAQHTKERVNVRICGEVPAKFERTLRELDRRGVTEFTGAFESAQIGALLADVDACVLPSMWWDCAPLAAAEALAARTPLIVPRLGGLPEAIGAGASGTDASAGKAGTDAIVGEATAEEATGLVFDALDAGDLTAQLDRLAGEQGLLERLQGAITQPRSFASYVDQLERYYRGEHPAPQAAPRPPRVRWKGPHNQTASLAIINDEITRRLELAVQRVEQGGEALDRPLAAGAAVEVRHSWPPDFSAPPSGLLAAIVPWEFGAIPTDWLEQINSRVDELWVPSEYARAMYLDAGIAPERVYTIPNGVDLDLFTPDGPRRPPAPPHTGPPDSPALRFLFVGGVTGRKGPDILCGAWLEAFPGREDVTLVIKDSGVDGAYRNSDRSWLREYSQSGQLPRIELLQDDLSAAELAALYRSCDVFVHPYRGEAFAMPVLEAMACGLPVIVTAGGPTDEFCPPQAAWRIRSVRKTLARPFVDHLATDGLPWMLEPDRAHLIALLREAESVGAGERERRGLAGREAAQRYTWQAAAALYSERLRALAGREPRRILTPAKPFEFEEQADLRVLATPAWRGQDELAELLREWAANTGPEDSACLYLLADPAVCGGEDAVSARILSAAEATGADLEKCADINVLFEPMTATRDRALIASVDVYVPLHGCCDGYLRLARSSATQTATVSELARCTTSIKSSRPSCANGSHASALSSS